MTSDPSQPPIVPGEAQQPQKLASVIPAPSVPKKRAVHPLSIVLAAVGGAALLCGGVLAVGSLGAFNVAANGASSPSPSPVYTYVTAPAAEAPTTVPTTQSAPTTTKPAPPPAPTIGNGIWTVGVDFPAGRYRVTANVGSDCYWAIYKSGTNGNDIIANDIPGGGRPTVTLKVGQDFTSQDCGTWAKIG